MDYRKELLHHLGLKEFVVVDLETTGLDPEKDTIIEIGAILYRDGQEAETFESLVNPRRPIPDFITRLTGIRDEDVADAPTIDAVFGQLEDFLSDKPFVGHQVNFDASFIEYQFRRIHQDFKNWDNTAQRFKYFGRTRLDTLFLARILLPFLPRLKLGAVAAYFGINLENAHRAVDDARATGQIFLELLDRALALDNQIIDDIIHLLFANSARARAFFVPLLQYKREKKIDTPNKNLLDESRLVQSYYNVIGEDAFSYTPQEQHRGLSKVDDQHIRAFYMPEGALSRVVENYEYREEQARMSQLIADGFNDDAIVVAEAGTGTGKSMAYMMPAVEWAVRNRGAGQRVIISTNTKNLQEQLFYKDIPALFAARKGDFKAALLKGRSNYLCIDKWRLVMTDMNQRLSQDERARVLPLVLWARRTRTGDIAENAGFQLENNRGLWQKFIAESSYCPGKNCRFYSDCFLMKARAHARRADLVVVNHALLFSDLASENSILGEYDNLVIDEAHNMEKTAAQHLGVRLSYWSFRNFYHRLYEDEPRKTGTVYQLEFRLAKSSLNEKQSSEIFRLIGKVKKGSLRMRQTVQQFYKPFNAEMREQMMRKGQNLSEMRWRYHKNFRYFRDHEEEIEDIRKGMVQLGRAINELSEFVQDLKADSFMFQDQIGRELSALQKDLLNLQEAWHLCINADRSDHVYWLEVPFNPRNVDVQLNAVPLKVAEILHRNLFSRLRAAALTSATLSVNKRFDYFKNRSGLDLLEDKKVEGRIFGSPFDFEHQIHLSVADFLPDPRNETFPTQLAAFLTALHRREKRGMMILFTSYSLLNTIHERLKPAADADRVLLLAQGKSGSRNQMVQQFRENRDSILLGTDSFWEGVDIPGEALQLLVIPKLPFDVPSDPLIAARMDEIKERGGNPFFEYSVPEAVIKFKQGFGRLIRARSDYGAVIACDNRLSRMRYGRQFLNSLPVSAQVYQQETALLDELAQWFREKENGMSGERPEPEK
ncbi:MAG: DEAD/DEAH box helicase [Calditrichaeota bacterium]|nr:MAG: DEAD/DEAH box helicase [Calditrichota bacterium]